MTYLAVAANYEPERDEFNVKRVLSEAGDTAFDGLFPGPNDLVVDTAHVWATDAAPTLAATGSVIPAERLLLFNPDSQVTPPLAYSYNAPTGYIIPTCLAGRRREISCGSSWPEPGGLPPAPRLVDCPAQYERGSPRTCSLR